MLGNRSRRPLRRTYLEIDPDDGMVIATTVPLPSRAAVPGWLDRVRSPETVAGRLRALTMERQGLDRHEAQAVDVARREGMAWADIGRLLGVSGERARQRHGVESASRAARVWGVVEMAVR